MKMKLICIVIIGMFLLTGVFGNASAIKNQVLSDDNKLESMELVLLGDPEEVYVYGKDYDYYGGDVTRYGEHAVRLSKDETSSAYTVYEIYLDTSYVKDGMEIGIYFCDWASYPWEGGPDLAIWNWSDDTWTVWKDIGDHDDLKWVWKTTTDSNDYVSDSWGIHISVDAGIRDDTILDTVGVKYTPKGIQDLNAYVNSPLRWHDVPLGSKQTGKIYVENIGEPYSELDWKIEESLNWVECYPTSGTNLLPGESRTIYVTVTAPYQNGEQRSGTIKVINTDNPPDNAVFNVEITTKKGRARPLFFQSLERLLDHFPLLERLLNLQ